MQAGDKPIAENSCGLTRHAATTGNIETDLTNEAPSRAMDHSAGLPVTQHSATLGHSNPEDG